ncbi:MAG TPA: hypothetical protein VM915_02035 [Verrucomicrobiae bacterium]|jgi:hypothetical protein|nr:hypothetical protein [Verrucomicrobiae bacterium]
MTSDRAALKQDFFAVRDVLTEVWNPVGVGGLPADEYDSYVWPIVRLLRENPDDATLAAHLITLERDYFARNIEAPQLAPVIKALRALGIEATEGCES